VPPNRPALPASQGYVLDVPLIVEIGDRDSLYGGFAASTSQSGMADWSALAGSSSNLGFQVDLYQQTGDPVPTVTLQTTVCRIRRWRRRRST